jgi:Uma2 family endonuclease
MTIFEKIEQLSDLEKERLGYVIDELLRQRNIIREEDEEQAYEPLPSNYYDANQTEFSAEDLKAIVKKFPKNKKWKVQDLRDEQVSPSETKVKMIILKNRLYIMPNPSITHQKVLTDLVTEAGYLVRKNKLGEVYVAPVSVDLDENNHPEPDIIFIAVSRVKELIIDEKAIKGAPDLVVEVISKANYKKLREAKKATYALFGVSEYWEVRPKKKTITVETLQNGEYKLYSEAKKNGIIKSLVIQDLELNLESVFSYTQN